MTEKPINTIIGGDAVIRGETLPNGAVLLREGTVEVPNPRNGGAPLVHRRGAIISKADWLKHVGPLPQHGADDAPVGYSAQAAIRDSKAKPGSVEADILEAIASVEAMGFGVRNPAVDGIMYGGDDLTYPHYLNEYPGVRVLLDHGYRITGLRAVDRVVADILDTAPGEQGISQTILADAAAAADLEPVSEPDGDEQNAEPLHVTEAVMDDRLDRLMDYYKREGVPAHHRQVLVEVMADDTPDPALMADVLFVLDMSHWQTRAIFTEDGIRLEGNTAHDLLPIIPQILESAMNYGRTAQAERRRAKDRAERAERQFETLSSAGTFIRNAIYSGDGEAIDAATTLIQELHDWVGDNEFPHGEAWPPAPSTPATEAWAGKMADEAAKPSVFGDIEPAPDQTEAVLTALCGSANTRDHAEATLGDPRNWPTPFMPYDGASLELGPRSTQEGWDTPLTSEEHAAKHLDAVLQQETIGLDLSDEQDIGALTIFADNAFEMERAYARAQTMGTAFLKVTHTHGEGYTLALVDPTEAVGKDLQVLRNAQSRATMHGAAALFYDGETLETFDLRDFRPVIDPDTGKIEGMAFIPGWANEPLPAADVPEPQDSDAPDGVTCQEVLNPAEAAYIQARHIAKRHGAAIIECIYLNGTKFVARNPNGWKLKAMEDFHGGKRFVACPRKPKP